MKKQIPLFDHEDNYLIELVVHVKQDLSDMSLSSLDDYATPEVSWALRPDGLIILSAGEEGAVMVTPRQLRVLLKAAHEMLDHVEKDCHCPCGEKHPIPACCPFCNGRGVLVQSDGIQDDSVVPMSLDRIDCPKCTDVYPPEGCTNCAFTHFVVGHAGDACPWRDVKSRHRHYVRAQAS